MLPNSGIMCPSARCKEGAVLLGIVQQNGRISFANERIGVDERFVQIARLGRSPEKRFRFSDDCINCSCAQWINGRCSVIDGIIHTFSADPEPSELPNCSIRTQCRWYKQCGGGACSVCPQVITDLRSE
jgi:hypothetical protein